MKTRKFAKAFYRITIILLTVMLIVAMLINRAAEVASGSYTAETSPMTDEDKKWVHETFGEYSNFEDLLYHGLIPFAQQHFVYDADCDYTYLAQTFNFAQFRRGNWHGVCYHFTQWAKTCVVELYGERVQAFIVDVRVERKFDLTHSYNYFVITNAQGNDETFFLDLTSVVGLHRQNKPYEFYAKSIGTMSFYKYSDQVLNDEVYRIY